MCHYWDMSVKIIVSILLSKLALRGQLSHMCDLQLPSKLTTCTNLPLHPLRVSKEG